MATLLKQVVVNGRINDLSVLSAKKTTGFCLSAANQLAARLGGGASLVEAQSEVSHGKVLANDALSAKVDAIQNAIAATRKVLAKTKLECDQIQQRNSMVNADVVPVDPSINTIVINAVSEALRGAQAATLGIAEVTDANAPSSLEAKIKMLKKIYLAAKKQTILSIIQKPYLQLLNKVTSAAPISQKGAKK